MRIFFFKSKNLASSREPILMSRHVSWDKCLITPLVECITSLEKHSRLSVSKTKSYHVWALGRLSVLASIKWIVKSLGPAEPVEPYKDTF